MRTINVAILGAGGWMGRAHTMGFRNQSVLFGSEPAVPVLHTLVDVQLVVLGNYLILSDL